MVGEGERSENGPEVGPIRKKDDETGEEGIWAKYNQKDSRFLEDAAEGAEQYGFKPRVTFETHEIFIPTELPQLDIKQFQKTGREAIIQNQSRRKKEMTSIDPPKNYL